MNGITIIVLVFSVIGAIDFLLGNKIGIGKEFEKAFSLFGPMALTMIGILVLSPALAVWMKPIFDGFYHLFGLDPSIIPASLFANDMGGMSLAREIGKSAEIGNYNAFVVSSMMGCVISFTIPLSLGVVKKEQHKELFFGLLCGIVTIPIGCFVAGLLLTIPPMILLANLLPLIILAALVGVALVCVPKICIKCFQAFGFFMKAVAMIGLICAVFTFLTKVEISPHFDTLEGAASICVNACITLSGALPFMFLVAKVLHKPLSKVSEKIGINTVSSVAMLGCLVTNVSTFGMMERMDKRGAVLNSALAVSAAFVLGSHLAFTLAFDGHYVLPMIVGKLISGICGVLLALLTYKEKPTSDLSTTLIE